MKPLTLAATDGWGQDVLRADRRGLSNTLLGVVDAGLFSVICVVPFFLGGRHDFGRLLLVSLIAVTSTAWFLRQATLKEAAWPRTWAHSIVLLAAGMLVLQLVPLPVDWLHRLSPRLVELLPLWSIGAADAQPMGAWRTISLVPHETTKSLAMLLSYGLLLTVVAGRIQNVVDVRRFLGWVGLASVAMAVFGVVQYFTSDGRFFWFYSHPYRSTTTDVCGAFINRNHFAHFLILGIGPLVAWFMHVMHEPRHADASQQPRRIADVRMWLLAVAIIAVMLASIASRSRGGAMVLIVALAVLFAVCAYRGIVDSRALYGVVSFALVMCAVLSWRGFDPVINRLDDLTEGSIEELDRNGIRRKVWAANVAAIKSFPMFGAGAGSHREICPVYLSTTLSKDYTHAENGYLQIATENGMAGALLLMVLMGITGGWCVTCLRGSQPAEEVFWFAAAAAGLAASAVHSLVDFVWYIPACMSVTVVLAGCVMRLSQLAAARDHASGGMLPLPRGRWLELGAAAALVGGWTIQTYVGPAFAALHWDRYLRASVASSELADETMAAFVTGKEVAQTHGRRSLSHEMLQHLEAAIAWDPKFGRAHGRLADRYMAEFELRAADAANVLDVAQIRDAAMGSSFTSAGEFRAWLVRAFGPDADILYRAHRHARRALEFCPLQGDAYVRLAELAFLDRSSPTRMDAYIEQGLRVRPNDRNVLIRAGRQEFFMRRYDLAIKYWAKCFHAPGRHQPEIIYRLVRAGMPPQEFLERFRPDWRTLREIWAQYKQNADSSLNDVLSYAEAEARRESAAPNGIPTVYIWYWLSQLYADANRSQESLDSLRRAYACDPRQYFVRRALAKGLQENGSIAEAEPHVRWCLARRPLDKSLRDALENIAKARVEQRRTALPIDSRWKPSVSLAKPSTQAAVSRN